jgi:hypothetical protein
MIVELDEDLTINKTRELQRVIGSVMGEEPYEANVPWSSKRQYIAMVHPESVQSLMAQRNPAWKMLTCKEEGCSEYVRFFGRNTLLCSIHHNTLRGSELGESDEEWVDILLHTDGSTLFPVLSVLSCPLCESKKICCGDAGTCVG